MTTVANKHGLRAAAGERTRKHAQRTPLPAKRIPTEQVAAEVAARHDAIVPVPASGDSKSVVKAKAFVYAIEANGWTADRAWGEEDDHIVVTASRGSETIFIEWIGGVYQGTATYTIADRTIKLRNASAAKQYGARAPEAATAELTRVATNRLFRPRETPAEKVEASKQPLPFDTGTALEDEILSTLAGRRISWHNRFREVTETAVFPVKIDPRFTRITEDETGRVVHFCSKGDGFRSFRLAALLSVSRGASASTRRARADAKRATAKAVAS